MPNLLFICGKNKYRSPTAENIMIGRGYEDVRSAGIDNDAQHQITPEDIGWADIILAMESKYVEKLRANFSQYLKNKKIVNLQVPDNYTFMQPELVTLLENKLSHYK